MQKTKFPIEILVHDDASVDKTASIIKEFVSENPKLFRCIYELENQFRKYNNLTNILMKWARGKYIAMCEGDDYWTDPLKLQKQVDFLEAHPEVTVCGHRVVKVDGHGTELGDCYGEAPQERTTIRDIIKQNYLVTPSVMFRNVNLDKWTRLARKLPQGDWPLYVFLAQSGDIGFIDEVMAAYRVHEKGMWNSLKPSQRQKNEMKALKVFQQLYGSQYSKEIDQGMIRVLTNLKRCYECEGVGIRAKITAFRLIYKRITMHVNLSA